MPAHVFQVSPREKGQTLAALLKRHLSVSWAQAKKLIERRSVRVNGQVCADVVRRPKPGARIDVWLEKQGPARPAPLVKPPANAKSPATKKTQVTTRRAREATPRASLVYMDDHILVVEKPSGITTMRHAEEAAEFGARAKRFLPPTLADQLPRLTGKPEPVRAVHRLDRDTSGLVVFARTPEAEADLGQQFRAHTIARRYLALVRGRPSAERIESWLVRDRGDGRRGSGEPGEGQRAVTHVRLVEELGPYALVECRLETGRTHQVRIHLGESGAPLCGERVYDRPPHGAPHPDGSAAPRVMLHAATLGLKHPASGEWMEWHSPLPADMEELLKRLRSMKNPSQ